MPSVTDDDSLRAISGALGYVLQDSPDKYRNVMVAYETTDETVGALSFTCCPEHTLKLLALASVVIVEDPATPFGQPCQG